MQGQAYELRERFLPSGAQPITFLWVWAHVAPGTITGVERHFGTGRPYTVGVEEEFQLVDPSTGELAQAIE